MTAPAPTVPWNIPLFDDDTPYAPVQAPLNAQSNALNAALNLIETSVANVASLPTSGNWVGRTILVTADNGQRVWTGSAWFPMGGLEVVADVVAYGTGWSAADTLGNKPRVRRIGNHCLLYGGARVASGASGANILTVPPQFQPPTTATRFIGNSAASNGTFMELALSNGVVSSPAGYGTFNDAQGMVIPVIGSWWMD